MQWCHGHRRGNSMTDNSAKQVVIDHRLISKYAQNTHQTTPISITTTKNVFKKCVYKIYRQNIPCKCHVITNILITWNIFQEYT